jgi:hypothetical protein
VGGWGVGPHPPTPNPQSPIPNPQSPFLIFMKIIHIIIKKFIYKKHELKNKIIKFII